MIARTASESKRQGRRLIDESRGVALVEMAILMPLLLLLIIGIFEFGAVFRDFLTTSSSVRTGARLISAQGDSQYADCNALKAISESMSTATDLNLITSIQIFQANSSGDQIANKTNTYQFTGSSSDRCTLSVNPLVEFEGWTNQGSIQYPSTTRQVLVGQVPLDIVGVRIIYTHNWITGFPPFRGVVTIDEQTIARLEPQGTGVGP